MVVILAGGFGIRFENRDVMPNQPMVKIGDRLMYYKIRHMLLAF